MIGTKINNYEIISQIGEGGMGAVYLARHPFLDRKTAVKVLREGLARDPSLVQRFFNEARAAAAIRHPNIIDVIDVGMLPGTQAPYLMMEYLDGESLSARIKRGVRLDPAFVLSLAGQTASALSAAHSKGIVHRDLKPENLFLVPNPQAPERELVKVLDFGIAKLHGELGADQVHTQTGALMGTPPYMSPEQCRGVSAQIDHRTDIYALGIILYEMFCGSPPFLSGGFGDILVMHLTQPPPPPRSRNPNIPEHIESVILKALAKSSSERFATMLELQHALEARPGETIVLSSSPPPPAPVTTVVDVSMTSPEAPIERGTTTFSSVASEREDPKPSLPTAGSSRRGFFIAGAVGVVAIAGAILGLGGKPTVAPGGAGSAVATAEPAVPTVNLAVAAPIPDARPDAGPPPVDAGRGGGPRKGTKLRPTKSGPEKW